MRREDTVNAIPVTTANVYKPSVIIFNSEGKILLVESKRKPGTWKTVGGRAEEGETILACIKREMLEECGTDHIMIVGKIATTGVCASVDEPDVTVEIDFFEVEVEEEDLVFNFDENKDYKWFALEDLSSGKVNISRQLKEILVPAILKSKSLDIHK